MARLQESYEKEIVPAMVEQFHYTNRMAVPRLEKIVVNVGLGEAIANPRLLDSVADELAAITGQKAIIKKARRAIASFKLRAGMPIGVMVTLAAGADVRVPGSTDQHCFAPGSRLPGCCDQRLRRTRELYAGYSRSDDLSRSSMPERSSGSTE